MQEKSKEFTLNLNDGTKEKVHFVRPSQDDLFQLDLKYRQIYSEAIRQDVMTEAEAVKRLEMTGAWGEQDEEETNDMLVELSKLQGEIKSGQVKKEAVVAKKIMEISKLRRKIMEKMTVKNNILEQTCEGLAEDQKRYYYISLCTMKGEEKFFEDFDAFKDFLKEEYDAGSELYKRAYFFLHDLSEDPTSEWAEV